MPPGFCVTETTCFLMNILILKRGFVFIVVTILLATIFGSGRYTEPASPSTQVTATYQNNFQELKKASAAFNDFCRTTHSEKEPQKLLTLYYQLRDAFKRTEFIWEYLDPTYVKEWINGAPLPKLDKNAPSLLVIDPKGLQVLDELLFGDSIDWTNLKKIASELNEAIQQYPMQGKVNDRQIIDATRMELIRLFTLGLTGFDVPASDRSMQDATVVWKELEKTIMLYYKPVFAKDKKLAESIRKKAEMGTIYLLKYHQFDEFDRLSFLRSYVNPLFNELRIMQELLGIESIYETVSNTRFAFNYRAGNLFDNSILDASTYLQIPDAIQSAKLTELGRLLFYDPVLSINNDKSCASCHQPSKAFTDGLPKSKASSGTEETVDRNAPTLINCVYSERFFYDLRADALEDQMEHVVVSEKEFNTTFFEITSRLAKSNEYKKRFETCFPMYPQPIGKQTIAFAMAAYVGSLNSFNSTFDRYVRNETNNLPEQVKLGFNIFMGKAACGTCHFAPVFNGTVPPYYNESETEVLGVPENPYIKEVVLDKDEGRIKGKLKESVDFYRYSFKTPTVRNTALTAPYMHNGAYRTLDDVIDFYNHGGGAGMGLHVPYQTLSPDSLNLTAKEMNALVAFMQSLTDTVGLTSAPAALPIFNHDPKLNKRTVGDRY